MKDKKNNKDEQNQEKLFSKRIEEIKAGRKRGRGGGKGGKKNRRRNRRKKNRKTGRSGWLG